MEKHSILKRTLLVCASAVMCASLASVPGSASAKKPSVSSVDHAKYELFENIYRMPKLSYRKFENFRSAYDKMSPKQQEKVANKLVGRTNHADAIRSRKQKAYAHRMASQQMHAMYHSHGLYDYFKNVTSVLDSPYVTDHQAAKAFNRYLKVYPRILNSRMVRRRYNYAKRVWRHANVRKQERIMRQETFSAINYDREAHHLPPVRYSRAMGRVAGMRAKQLTHSYSHYGRHGSLLMNDDMKRLHMGIWDASENIDAKGAPSVNFDTNGSIYIPINGFQIAEAMEDGFVYHDYFKDRRPGIGTFIHGEGSAENGGHRTNILDPEARTVGIAVSYSRRTHTFYLAEDFHSGFKKAHRYNGRDHYHDYLKDHGFRKI